MRERGDKRDEPQVGQKNWTMFRHLLVCGRLDSEH